MTENLVQHRSGRSVWEDRPRKWDAERWLTAVAAGACLVVGVRRQSMDGLLLAVAGGALGWWSLATREERRTRRASAAASLRRPQRPDKVDEASEASFPASDAPAYAGAGEDVTV